jgi:hypothetical protein
VPTATVPVPTATVPVPTATVPVPTATVPCPQCSVSLTCVNSGSYLAWGAASAISSDCPENVFCSNKSPNIPGIGYWGCCSTVGDTATYTFNCPDCAGNPGPYSTCNSPTATPNPNPTATPNPNPTATPPCQINCGNSNGDGYCGLDDGCGGICQCTDPNTHCENYSCVSNALYWNFDRCDGTTVICNSSPNGPGFSTESECESDQSNINSCNPNCGTCTYSYSFELNEWQQSNDNCYGGCACPEASGCNGGATCTTCSLPCSQYQGFISSYKDDEIEW